MLVWDPAGDMWAVVQLQCSCSSAEVADLLTSFVLYQGLSVCICLPNLFQFASVVCSFVDFVWGPASDPLGSAEVVAVQKIVISCGSDPSCAATTP
jgi:hypothetical protein